MKHFEEESHVVEGQRSPARRPTNPLSLAEAHAVVRDLLDKCPTKEWLKLTENGVPAKE